MTEFEKELRELAQKDLSLAIKMLLEECGDNQSYFHGANEDGVTIFIHSNKEDQSLLEGLEEGMDILEGAIEELENMNEIEEKEDTDL